MKLKNLEVPLEIKEFDAETGVFEGYGNVANFKDFASDVTMNGAFQKSLQKHESKGTMPALLYQHQRDKPIGVWTEVKEDEHGLYVKGKLTKGVQLADETHLLMKDGALSGLSIGYMVVEEEYDRETKTNYLKEVDLREISVVTFPCNDESRISTIKSVLADNGIPSKKDLENSLRDAGFSRTQAKGFLSKGYTFFDDQRDADSIDEEAILKALSDLSKANPASE